MNLEQAKAKLHSVKNGTGTKHPKAMILELCSIIGFLMDELDRIKSPPVTLEIKKSSIAQMPWNAPSPYEPRPPLPKKRSGNAGDTE